MPWLTYRGTVAFATYRDLWLEAGDPEPVAAFWAGALGLELEATRAGGYVLTGPSPSPGPGADPGPVQTVHVVPSAPGALTGFRMHVEVHASKLQELSRLGACAPDDGEDAAWLELAGPEGGDVRCFATSDPLDGRRYELVLAAGQPARAARWWARVLGALHESAAGGDYAWVSQIPGAPFDTLLFTRELPAPRPQRARMRLTTTDMPGLIRYGAAMVAAGRHTARYPDERLPTHVMRCAEGIEFIVVDASGSPETARTSRPARPGIGPR